MPSGFGAASATPAPCTTMIAATASAPEITDGVNAATAGREGIGSPCGIAPRSETLATPGTPARITTTVGTRSATSDATDATRVLDRTASSRTAPRPAATEGRCIRVGWMTNVERLRQGKASLAGRAGQRRQLSEEDVGTQSGEESQHHRLGDESNITTETQHPTDEHRCAGDQGQPDQGIRTLGVRYRFDGRTRSQGRRARGGDHHHLGAGGQSASHPSDQTRVEALDRAHTGQYAVGHAVGNSSDRARHRQRAGRV